MRYIIFFTSILISLNITAQQKNQYEYVPNEIIIKIKRYVSQNITKAEKGYAITIPAINKLNTKYNCTTIDKVFRNSEITKKGSEELATIFLLKFHDIIDVPDVIDEYLKTGYLDYAEPNYIEKIDGEKNILLKPNDYYYSSQWWLNNTNNYAYEAKAGADIDAERAWNITTGSSSIVVGIIDTGINYDHVDFSGRIWTNPNEIPNNGIDDDHNTYVDDYSGWDFYNNDNNPKDDNGHGTNVSGILGAASNNSTGYTGIDWKCKLLPLKVTNSEGYASLSALALAIYYATDINVVRILNISISGSDSQTKRTACDYANINNVIIVSSMGNDDMEKVGYPAGYSYVIAVGATDPRDYRASPFTWGGGSNYGNHIKVVAPGCYMSSLSHTSNTGYTSYYNGTSQATPVVAGICALVLAQRPSRTVSDVRTIITSTAEDMVGRAYEDVAGFDKYHGYGRVNAYYAVTYTSTFINELSNEPRWAVFQNPAHNTLFLSLENIDFTASCTIKISNQLGCVVKNIIPNNPKEIISLHNFNAGIYYITLTTDNFSETKKVVIQ